MHIYAQIDRDGKLHQFVAFSSIEGFEAHSAKHSEFEYIETDFFGSPDTHYHDNGKILPKAAQGGSA